MKRMAVAVMWLAVVALWLAGPAGGAVERTWNGPATGDWFTAANWLPVEGQDYPQAGDTVIIHTGSVLLTNETAELAAFSITNATLTFSNWNTRLTASDVTIGSGGTVTLPSAFPDAGPSNRVWIVCTDLTVATNGSINVDGKGYTAKNGPGKSGSNYAGAGYGGKGGDDNINGVGGPYCGVTNAPTLPGSGGSHASGGGAVLIEASGDVAINGTITANGNGGTSGGSGGAIYITCAGSFTGGTGGVLRAIGGSGQYGAGGGGRIAVVCANIVKENVRLSFAPSAGTGSVDPGGMGTLFLSNTNLLSETLDQFSGARIVIPDFTEWSVANLTISNRLVSVGPMNGGLTRLAVANDLTVLSNGVLGVGGLTVSRMVSDTLTGTASNPVVTVGGKVSLSGGGALVLGVSGQGSGLALTVGTEVVIDGANSMLVVGGASQGPTGVVSIGSALTLTNGGAMSVYGGMTNAATADYGTLVTVAGAASIGPSSWIYPFSQSTNGGSVLFRVGTLAIAAGGGINADGRGFAAGRGPGKAVTYSGGAYGGNGGNGGQGGGVAYAYGSTNAPIDPGSGGSAGAGGGAVRIEASGNMAINGIVTANGTTASGAGSGGGIFMTCAGSFSGDATGNLRANGGNGGSFGGGGGGRIAVWAGVSDAARDLYLAGTTNAVVRDTTNKFYMGVMTVDQGTGGNPAAEAGSKFFFTPRPVLGTVLQFR